MRENESPALSHSFFFSSRRRHTRSLCDWSSDVCSSDLNPPRRKDRAQPRLVRPRPSFAADLRLKIDSPEKRTGGSLDSGSLQLLETNIPARSARNDPCFRPPVISFPVAATPLEIAPPTPQAASGSGRRQNSAQCSHPPI